MSYYRTNIPSYFNLFTTISSLIKEISEFAAKQAGKPFLKRLVQADEIKGAVTDYNQRLLHMYNTFNVSWIAFFV